MNKSLDFLEYEVPAEKYFHYSLPIELAKFIGSNADPVVTAFWLTNPNVYICGGTMRAYYSDQKETVKDIDLYFNNQETFDSFIATMKSNDYTPSFESERAITYKSKTEDGPDIQAIRYVMGTIETVLGEFDFTIVKCGASCEEVVMHKDFSDDLDSGVLIYCGSKLPLSSLNRAFKYNNRGYFLPAKQMIAIVVDITEKVALDNPEDILYHLESFDPNEIIHEESEE